MKHAAGTMCSLSNAFGISNHGDSKWQDLPAELLVQILSLTDHRTTIISCGVCTSWRDTLCSNVLELSFSWCKESVSKLLKSVAPKFTRLQICSLKLREPKSHLTDEAIQALAKNCHDLRSLDLSSGTHLTNASIFALASGCQRLERLNLSGCPGITEVGLIALADNCKRLTHLNLCGCYNAGTDQALLALASNCGGLQSLNLGWCDKVTDNGITGLALWCPHLQLLDLCGCILITDCSVIALADKCHRLKILVLYACRNITDMSMYSLANSSKYRTNHISDSTSSMIAGSYTTSSNSSRSSSNNSITSREYGTSVGGDEGGLVSLNLGMCASLSAHAVQAVCDAFPGLHTCSDRHSLLISGCLSLVSVHCICAQRERRNRDYLA